MNTIISKRTSPFTYTNWYMKNGQFHQDGPGIIINGGSGIVGGLELLSGRPLDKRSSIIPVGVHTYVDDEVLGKLMKNGKFLRDIERGLILVVKGKKLDQDKTDEIAAKEMVDDERIPTRPVTRDEMESAGASINNDGSVDIGEVDSDISPLKQRKIDAGAPSYVKKRNQDTRKRRLAERKSYQRLGKQ